MQLAQVGLLTLSTSLPVLELWLELPFWLHDFEVRWFILFSCSRWWFWLWRGIHWSYPGSLSMQTPAAAYPITAAVPQAARKWWTAVCPAGRQKPQAETFPKNTASSPRVGSRQLEFSWMENITTPQEAGASSSYRLELYFLVSVAEVLGHSWRGSSRRHI